MDHLFAGLDWASNVHAGWGLDAAGAVRDRFEVAHDAAGLTALLTQLRRLSPEARALPIAIERPSGLLVDTLIEAGLRVVPIHPNLVKATRPRYRSHGAKSDASDAYLPADLLRTDGARFAGLKPQSDQIRALRALVRGRDDLVATRVPLANQLRNLLVSFWPGAATVFADVDSPIALAFVQRYATPHATTRLGEQRMAGFLAQHPYCGRRTPAELLERLRTPPTGHADQLEADAKGKLVCALARVLSAARQRRCDHPHAIRILARAWTRVLCRLWVDQVTYHPAKHRAALALVTTSG